MDNLTKTQLNNEYQKPIKPDRPYVLFINTIVKTLTKLNVKYNESLIDDLWKKLDFSEKQKFFKIHNNLLKEYNKKMMIYNVKAYNNLSNKKILFTIDLN